MDDARRRLLPNPRIVNSLTTAATIFAVQYLSVFALGLQSLNVNNGHRRLAALTSVLISTTWLTSTYLTLIKNEINTLNIAAFIVAGVAGILSSMSAHPWLVLHLGTKSGNTKC